LALTYGCLKAQIASDPELKSTRRKKEIQYHLHTTLQFTNAAGELESWDSAINVGTNDSDDLLQYKLIFDYSHSFFDTVKASPAGFADLTGDTAFPALDFLRSDMLATTGPWRDSDIMDGSEQVEPVASLLRLLQKAKASNAFVYIFGRKYTDGDGIHDVHMNQGSTGSFLNNGVDDHNDHNDIWQDGGLIVDLGDPGGLLAAYFPAFTQQMVPTDNLGNPVDDSHPMTVADDGSLKT
jgi:Uncharacterized conserved protein (DUF2278)